MTLQSFLNRLEGAKRSGDQWVVVPHTAMTGRTVTRRSWCGR